MGRHERVLGRWDDASNFPLSLLLLSAALVLGASVSHAEDDPHRIYRVGFVAAQSPSTVPNGVSAFRDRLREMGYIQARIWLSKPAGPEISMTACPRSSTR